LDESDVDSVLIESLFKVWRYRTTFSPTRAPLDVWWCAIAIRSAQDHLRRKAHSFRTAALTGSEVVDERRARPEGENTDAPSDLTTAVREFLSARSSEDREVLLAFANGDPRTWATDLAASSALASLGLSPGALRVRKSRLVRSLNEHLKQRGLRVRVDDEEGSAHESA
jgi:DNA-directed RNA polymerase specialized sigma24 family protein